MFLERNTWLQLAVIAMIAVAVLVPETALAQTTSAADKLNSGLKALIDLLNGKVARSLAILAVIGFGIGALAGRVDWIRALQVILAIMIIFSAGSLIDLFAPTVG